MLLLLLLLLRVVRALQLGGVLELLLLLSVELGVRGCLRLPALVLYLLKFQLVVGGLLRLLYGHAPLEVALLVGLELLLLLLRGLLDLRLDLLRIRGGLASACLLLLLRLGGGPLLLLGTVRLASVLVLCICGHPLLILQHRCRHLLLRPSRLVLLGRHVLRLLARGHRRPALVCLACHLLPTRGRCSAVRSLNTQNWLKARLGSAAASGIPMSVTLFGEPRMVNSLGHRWLILVNPYLSAHLLSICLSLSWVHLRLISALSGHLYQLKLFRIKVLSLTLLL